VEHGRITVDRIVDKRDWKDVRERGKEKPLRDAGVDGRRRNSLDNSQLSTY
jgi:hypothetical protein